jgi:hypothetical protein
MGVFVHACLRLTGTQRDAGAGREGGERESGRRLPAAGHDTRRRPDDRALMKYRQSVMGLSSPRDSPGTHRRPAQTLQPVR